MPVGRVLLTVRDGLADPLFPVAAAAVVLGAALAAGPQWAVAYGCGMCAGYSLSGST